MPIPEPPATSDNTELPPRGESESERAYRTTKAKWDTRVATASAEAEGKTALAAAKATSAAADDAVDQRKAESYRARLIDPGRALARSWRTYRLLLGLLAGSIVLVIAWNARKVALAIGGPHPAPMDYAVEATFSVPLVVILALQVSAAQNERLAKVRPVQRTTSGWYLPTATGLLEAFLLLGSVAVCTWPAISAHPVQFEQVATSALPPFSLVAASVLLFVTTDLFADIFRDYRRSESEADNMRRRLELAMDLALDVERAQSGDNPLPISDDGLPSINAIGKRFKGEKAVHQSAHDLLTRFTSRKEVPTHTP